MIDRDRLAQAIAMKLPGQGEIPIQWARELIADVLSDISSQGYVIVPREPTEAMVNAGDKAGDQCCYCGGEGWVCENHRDRPWDGTSNRADACGCGAGAPCGACNLAMASAGYSEPWRELAKKAISCVADAVRETSWGQPTFGPDADEELQSEYDALLAQAIEARMGETGTGSVHESAVRQDAPND